MSDNLKKDSFGGNVNDGILHRLKAFAKHCEAKNTEEAVTAASIINEAVRVIRDIEKNRDDLYTEYCKAQSEVYYLKDKGIFFDVFPGDTVYTACEETDEYGNPITALCPWTVHGLAYKDGKKYAIDGAGELYEINTRFCIPTDKQPADSVSL